MNHIQQVRAYTVRKKKKKKKKKEKKKEKEEKTRLPELRILYHVIVNESVKDI
jgi:hypothetical protein